MKEIKLVNNNQVALVDDEDYEKVIGLTWYLQNKKYACYIIKNFAIFMHRLIMCAKEGQVVDHIDGNGLNNQKTNLRICTQVENGANRSKNKNNKSGYKGVSFISG